ncbi:MAG: hypothetical protein IJ899_07995 [Blautia sp.]|nr:hypothetical protein [Blautia sp.]
MSLWRHRYEKLCEGRAKATPVWRWPNGLTIPVNWVILTIALKLTEDKWLLNLYGQDYADYMKRVNRCIPWPPRKAEGEF